MFYLVHIKDIIINEIQRSNTYYFDEIHIFLTYNDEIINIIDEIQD